MELGWGVPPGFPGSWLGRKAFELEQALGAERMPASALALEAAVDVDLDVLFDGAGAGLDGGREAAHGPSEGGGDLLPGLDAVAITQEVAEEGAKLEGVSPLIGAGA